MSVIGRSPQALLSWPRTLSEATLPSRWTLTRRSGSSQWWDFHPRIPRALWTDVVPHLWWLTFQTRMDLVLVRGDPDRREPHHLVETALAAEIEDAEDRRTDAGSE